MPTVSEYVEMLTTAVQNPDKLPEMLLAIRQGIETDIPTIDTLKGELSTRDARIAELQQANVNLYLQVGHNNEQQDDGGDERSEEANPEEALDTFIKEEFGVE